MKREILTVKNKQSGISEFTSLVVSVREVRSAECDVVIGFPGLPNVSKKMQNGDAVLFETPLEGTVEARMIAHDYINGVTQFIVSQVSARIGLLGGTSNEDPNNAPFSEAELTRIAASIESAKKDIRRRIKAQPEQLELIERKLTEIQGASERMGRRDWINYVAGSLTSVCISAAFAPEITKAVFGSVNAAFVWLFSNGLLLLL